MTPDEYLTWERASDTKHEYYAGEIIDFAGASLNHGQIVENLSGIFYVQLRGKGCRSFSSDVRVRVGKIRAYLYPDLFVVCGTPVTADDQQDTVLNPALIIEVLSPSTEARDRLKKFDLYWSIPSVQEYLLVAQDAASIEQFTRQADGKWLYARASSDLGAEIALPSIGCVLKLRDVYEFVALPASADDDTVTG